MGAGLSKIRHMKVHPYANLFPMMNETEFQALKADIAQHGQRSSIIMMGNAILDGRNRWRACEELKIKPKTQPYFGDDPLGHVLSLNLNRRHLSASQRALLAAELKRNYKCPDNPLLTDTALAESASVTRQTLADAKIVAERAPEDVKAAVHAGKQSVSRVARELKGKPKATALQKVLHAIDRLNEADKAEIGRAYCPDCDH